ncbi:hypothetical protein FQU96_02100 [Reyranella sp. CPCC 100927]|nr:hypothetical protein FQU96_02100 [Reyranella sp. CPCC 100927]
MLNNDPDAAHYPIDATRRDLVDEFRRAPRGPHSRELQMVLHRMRWESPGGRYVLVTVDPGRRWVLGRLPGERGVPIELMHNKTYDSLAAAEWDVFKLRWEALTGQAIED